MKEIFRKTAAKTSPSPGEEVAVLKRPEERRKLETYYQVAQVVDSNNQHVQSCEQLWLVQCCEDAKTRNLLPSRTSCRLQELEGSRTCNLIHSK